MKSSSWLRRWAGGLVLLLVVLPLAWRVAGRDVAAPSGAEAQRAPGPAASAAVGTAALALPARGPSAAPAVAHASSAAANPAPAEARAALMQRMRADWCGFGAAEQSRQAEAVFEKAGAGGQPIGMDAIAEANRTPGAELVAAAVAQARQRWVAVLQQRGDPRALAVAEHLGGADGDAARASARLQGLARTSSDPMVTALALQRPCAPGACSNVERAQWSRLEPANLQAWLALLGEPAARRTQEAYALDRMASEARYSRSYQREYRELLLSLPQTEAPGLAQEAELQLLISSTAVWPAGSLGSLASACAARPVDPAVLQRCMTVAELQWRADELLPRGVAVGLARRLVAARPELRARWELRARELEALRQWEADGAERMQAAVAEAAGSPCAWQAELRRHLQATAAQGEWGRARAEMQAAGVDDAVLSARWRRDGQAAVLPAP